MPSTSLSVNAPSFLSTAPATDSTAGSTTSSGNGNGNSFQDLVNSSASQNQDAPEQTATPNTQNAGAPTTRNASKRQDNTDTTAAATAAASYVAVQSVVNVQQTTSDGSATTGTDTTIATAATDAALQDQFSQMKQLLSALSQSLTGTLPSQNSGTAASSQTGELSAIQDLAATLQQLEQGLIQPGDSQVGTSQAGTVQNNGTLLTNDQIDALLQRIETDVNQLASVLPLSNHDTSNTDTSSTPITSPNQVLKQLLAQATSQNTPDITGTSAETVTQSTSTNISTHASPATLLTELQSVFADLTQQLQSAVTAATTTTIGLTINAPIQLATSQQPSGTNQATGAPQQPANDATTNASASTTPVIAVPTTLTPSTTTPAPTINAEQLPVSSPINISNLSVSSTPPTNAAKDKNSNAIAPITNDAPILSASALLEIVHGGSKNTNSSNDNNQGQPSSLPITFTTATITNGAVTDTQSSFSNVLANASTSSILEQVTVQIKSTPTDGSSKISIQLQPAELGKLEIKLNVGTDGKTTVMVTADNKNTLDLLRQDSQGLTRALNDAGLSTNGGSLNFNLRGGQQQNSNGSQGNAPYTITQLNADDELPLPTAAQNYVVNLTNSLDIQI